jgi:hypothetical protein
LPNDGVDKPSIADTNINFFVNVAGTLKGGLYENAGEKRICTTRQPLSML